MAQIKEQVYRDINVTFTPHPVTGRLPIITNEEAVKKAIRNLILTNHYERPYRPDFGGDVLSQLFENFDGFTEHVIRKNIRLAIQNYEPRAEIFDVRVDGDNNRQILKVTVEFRVLNSTQPTEATFFIERTR